MTTQTNQRIIIIEPSTIVFAGLQSIIERMHIAESIYHVTELDTITQKLAQLRADIIIVNTAVFGFHKNLSIKSIFKDCTQAFNKAYNNMLNEADNYKIEIKAPLESLTKNQIIQEANALNIDLSTTWSCYKGDEVPCGGCPNCITRQKYKI